MGVVVMEYMSDEMVRWSFGFANPNHAAAAVFPFCGDGAARLSMCR